MGDLYVTDMSLPSIKILLLLLLQLLLLLLNSTLFNLPTAPNILTAMLSSAGCRSIAVCRSPRNLVNGVASTAAISVRVVSTVCEVLELDKLLISRGMCSINNCEVKKGTKRKGFVIKNVVLKMIRYQQHQSL